LIPVAQASIPHSIYTKFQLLSEKIKKETTYRCQNEGNGFYREGIEKIRINNTLITRIIEPTPIYYLLNYRVLVETFVLPKVLPKKD
jgi:hypothetical protein